MHRSNAGALTAEDTQKYLGLYVAFAAGILAATLFNLKRYLR
jgi:hypothetical protein